MINMNYSTNIMIIITYQNTTLADLTLILSTREVLTPLNGPSFIPNNFDLLLPYTNAIKFFIHASLW